MSSADRPTPTAPPRADAGRVRNRRSPVYAAPGMMSTHNAMTGIAVVSTSEPVIRVKAAWAIDCPTRRGYEKAKAADPKAGTVRPWAGEVPTTGPGRIECSVRNPATEV